MMWKICIVLVAVGSLSGVGAILALVAFLQNPYTYLWQQMAYEKAMVRNFWFCLLFSVASWVTAWVIWP